MNARDERREELTVIGHELRNLNESLQALAYAALGQQGPQVRPAPGRLAGEPVDAARVDRHQVELPAESSPNDDRPSERERLPSDARRLPVCDTEAPNGRRSSSRRRSTARRQRAPLAAVDVAAGDRAAGRGGTRRPARRSGRARAAPSRRRRCASPSKWFQPKLAVASGRAASSRSPPTRSGRRRRCTGHRSHGRTRSATDCAARRRRAASARDAAFDVQTHDLRERPRRASDRCARDPRRRRRRRCPSTAARRARTELAAVVVGREVLDEDELRRRGRDRPRPVGAVPHDARVAVRSV